MSKHLIITILTILLILLVMPRVVSARIVSCGRDCVKWSSDGSECLEAGKDAKGQDIPIDEAQPCNVCHFFRLLQTLFLGIQIAIVAWALLYVTIGGFTLLTAAGSNEQLAKGKRIIIYALVGVAIAFAAWTIINQVMLVMVGPGRGEKGVMPWPWDRIECQTIERLTIEEEEVEDGGGKEVKKGKYCVCEVPVYDLDPNKDSAASLIASSVETTLLSSEKECAEKCVLNNFNSYCVPTLTPNEANLYCASKADLQGKAACTVNIRTAECQASTTCYNSESDCENDAKTTYKQKCYLNGEFLCRCYTGAQGGLCGGSSSKYVLRRIQKEAPAGGSSLWDCETDVAKNNYCRLDCKYEACKEDKCAKLSPEGPCFGSFTCQKGVADQIEDASDQLKELINCMGNSSMPAIVKVISFITDNSNRECFNANTWKERGQCSSGIDSCTGTCCSHREYSLHYGAQSICENYSWAVDFSLEAVNAADRSKRYQGIKNVAEKCAEVLKYGKVDVIGESGPARVQVELEDIVWKKRCKNKNYDKLD